MDRVNLLLQEAAPRVLFHSHTPAVNTTSINIIMPLSGRLEMLRLFLDSLKEAVVESGLHLGLTVVYFENGESEAAKTVLKKDTDSIPHLATHFLLLHNQTFSRSLALKEGVRKSKVDAPVVFLCDVDVFFTASFLRRCLATPVEKKQVCLGNIDKYLSGVFLSVDLFLARCVCCTHSLCPDKTYTLPKFKCIISVPL